MGGRGGGGGNRTGKNVFSKRKKYATGLLNIYIYIYKISYRGRIRQWRNTPGRRARSRRWDVRPCRGRGLLQWPEIQVPRAAATVTVARGFGSGAAKGYIRFRLTRIRDGLERTREMETGWGAMRGVCSCGGGGVVVVRSYSRRGWSGRTNGGKGRVETVIRPRELSKRESSKRKKKTREEKRILQPSSTGSYWRFL